MALELRSDLVQERAGLEPAEPRRWGVLRAVSVGNRGSDTRSRGPSLGAGAESSASA